MRTNAASIFRVKAALSARSFSASSRSMSTREASQLAVRAADQILTLEHRAAAGDAAGARQDPEDRER